MHRFEVSVEGLDRASRGVGRWGAACACVTTLVLASVGGGTPASASPPSRAGKVFVGYVFGPPRDIDFRLYTHLCHAFLTADGDGKIRPNPRVPSRDLVTSAHEAGAKVLVSLGGWGWDKQFASIVSKPEAEARYVESVLKMIDEFDYDGIDLDWEYPDTEAEVIGFERLTRTFRKELDAIGARKSRPMFVTMAASSNEGTLKWLAPAFLLETMDWINVMTYDYTGEWTEYAGHQSPLFASRKQPGKHPRSTELSMKYLAENRKLPKELLAVGIPLYGRGFAAAEPYGPKQKSPGRRLPGGNYANIHKLMKEPGWTRVWDDETKNPWLISRDPAIVIGYDDAESVEIKTKWAMDQGFRGVFFWQVHGDRLPDGTTPLQAASHKAWQEARDRSRR